jgi:hypothetical protein
MIGPSESADAAGDDDVGAVTERLRDRSCAEIGVGENDLVAHARDVGAGVHVGKGFALALEFVDAIRNGIAGDDRDLCLEAFLAECAGDGLARAARIEPAGVHHELHAARGRKRPQLDQHRHAVARVAGGGVFLAVLLQDRERQFGEMIAGNVLDVAAFDRGAHRTPGIAVKAEPGADADRFHDDETVSPRFPKSKCLVQFAKHQRVIPEAANGSGQRPAR